MRLPAWTIRNSQFTLILIMVLAVAGLTSFLTMPRSEDPQVAPNGASVVAIYPGANPSDIEELIIDPLEDALNELNDIKRLDSSSQEGVGVIDIEFESSADMNETYAQLVQKVNSLRSELPEDLLELRTGRWLLSDYVIILQLALVSESAPMERMEAEAERLKQSLELVPGVKRVRLLAIPAQQVRISLDLQKLAQNRISLQQVMTAVKAGNANIPGGALEMGGMRFTVKASGPFRSLEDVGRTIIQGQGEKLVYLRDLADIRFDTEDELYLARTNGRRSVFITVNQKDGTNIFTVMKDIRQKADDFRGQLPASMTLETVFDQSGNVSDRLNIFLFSLLQGLILVGLMILLAMDLRASAVIMLVIPASVLICLFFLDLGGYGLQMMTISGLVIALGMLVDNGIVVTDNIARFMRLGLNNEEAAVRGTGQVGWAVVNSTVTTILAFLPIALMQDMTGAYIRSMPLTVSFALAASLFLALTLTPILSRRMFVFGRNTPNPPLRRLLLYLLNRTYRPTLDFALRRPKLLLLVVGAVFIGTLALFPLLGVSLFPKAEKPQFLLNIDLPHGSSLEQTDRAARFVESVLAEREEVKNYALNLGHSNPTVHYSMDSREAASNYAQALVILKNNDLDMIARLVADLRRAFADYPGGRIEVKELEQGPPVLAPIAIRVLGPNMDQLRALAGDVEGIFRDTAGTVNIHNPQSLSKIDLRLRVDKAKAGMFGLLPAEIDWTVRAALSGMTVSKFRDAEGREYDIVVRLPLGGRPKVEDLERITVPSLSGALVPLGQVASLEFESSPREIEHHNFERSITLTADVVRGASVDKTTKSILARLDGYSWPKGYRYSVSGEAEAREESFGGMGRAIFIALLAIFAVLGLQFRSFFQPFIIFSTIPLGIIGVIWALFITGNSFSFTAFVGLTSLVGIVVNNAIILVDYVNQLRAGGKELREALTEAGQTRFVPILLTTGTTILGLLPLALQGGTMMAPMGWTIMGGLAVSSFLTLVAVPALYLLYTPKSKKVADM